VRQDLVSTKHMNNDYSRWTGVPERGILSEANLLAKDPAKIWGKTDEAPPKTTSLLPNADGYRSSDSALFDIDIPVAVGGSNDRAADMATITGEHNSSTMESVPSDVAAVDRKALMESIQTDKIPCPRLCSATFCFGTGNIVGALLPLWIRQPLDQCSPFLALLPFDSIQQRRR
jgi:hypothetical protein